MRRAVALCETAKGVILDNAANAGVAILRLMWREWHEGTRCGTQIAPLRSSPPAMDWFDGR